MKVRNAKIISVLLLAIFVNMAIGTTLFYHSHDNGGVRTVHSHPFVPGNHHSHTDAACMALQAVASSMHTMVVTQAMHIVTPRQVSSLLSFDFLFSNTARQIAVRAGRAPPVCGAI